MSYACINTVISYILHSLCNIFRAIHSLSVEVNNGSDDITFMIQGTVMCVNIINTPYLYDNITQHQFICADSQQIKGCLANAPVINLLVLCWQEARHYPPIKVFHHLHHAGKQGVKLED